MVQSLRHKFRGVMYSYLHMRTDRGALNGRRDHGEPVEVN